MVSKPRRLSSSYGGSGGTTGASSRAGASKGGDTGTGNTPIEPETLLEPETPVDNTPIEEPETFDPSDFNSPEEPRVQENKEYGESGSNSKWWHEDYVDNLSDTQTLLGVQQSGKGNSTLGSSTRENAISAGKAWVGENYKTIVDKNGDFVGYSSEDGMRAFRIQYKPQDGMWRANFQENTMVSNSNSNPGQHRSTLKNVHIDITD